MKKVLMTVVTGVLLFGSNMAFATVYPAATAMPLHKVDLVFMAAIALCAVGILLFGVRQSQSPAEESASRQKSRRRRPEDMVIDPIHSRRARTATGAIPSS